MSTKKELAFHSSAVDNFRERGQRLLTSMKPIQRNEPRPRFRTDRHPTIVLTDKDISGIGPRQTVDSLTLEVSEIAFSSGGGAVALEMEGCLEVDKLSET